jgi:DNA-binding GntR family transcriptional regulator
MISREELREAFLVRAELEALVTELAVPRFDEQRLAALRAAEDAFARLTGKLLQRGHDPEQRNAITGDWVRANYRFHDVIYEAAAVPFVEAVAKGARRTFLSRWRAGGPELDDLYEQNTREHHAIVGAIAARSAEGARALAHEHVLHSGRLLEVILDHVAPHAA